MKDGRGGKSSPYDPKDAIEDGTLSTLKTINTRCSRIDWANRVVDPAPTQWRIFRRLKSLEDATTLERMAVTTLEGVLMAHKDADYDADFKNNGA